VISNNSARNISVVGVPSFFGQSHCGVGLAPQALRQAGLIEQLRGLGLAVKDCGDLGLNGPAEKVSGGCRLNLRNLAAVAALSEILYRFLDKIMGRQNSLPLILGGDHSISIGSIAAIAPYFKNLGVIWFDAHPDLNSPETSPSGNIHGMSLAVSLGIGHPRLVEIGGMRQKIKPENVVIIGARAIDGGEAALIERKGIKLFSAADVRSLGMREVMRRTISHLGRCDGIHLSLDLDAVDPKAAPGVGTPVPGGILPAETKTAMEILNEAGLLTSAEIVELNPKLDKRNKTVLKAITLASLLLQNRPKGRENRRAN